MTERILIIEDEEDLISTLEYALQKEGYEPMGVMNGADGLAHAQKNPGPDLVLLDLNLPDMSGLEVCRRLREMSHLKALPIVMMTAKSEEIDRVVGFEVGADDYVVKPFSVRELILRIKAILRRAQPVQDAKMQHSFGILRIDQDAHQVWVGEDEVVLTALEFRLLVTFMERKGRAQSRDKLLSDVWGYGLGVTTRTVDTHVKRLRMKLLGAGKYIETLRGVGYRFCAKPDEAQD